MEKIRNQSLDLLKIIAMIGVIALHSSKAYIVSGQFSMSDIIYNFGMVSMPMFFMVSGYLLLNRENITYAYAIKKIWGIVRFVAIITISFSFLVCIKNGFSWTIFAENFFGSFVQKGSFSVFWYFGAIIICYSLMPWLSKLLLDSCVKYLMVLSVFFIASVSFFCQTLISGGGIIYEFQMPSTFRLYYIIFYFMLGGIIHFIPKIKIPIIYLVFLLIVTFFHKEYLDDYIASEFASLFYSSPVVMLLCLCFFIYFNGLPVNNNKVITELSKLFLPVYTIHMFAIGFVTRVMPYSLDLSIQCLIVWVGVTVISILVSYMIMKIPFANKIFRI